MRHKGYDRVAIGNGLYANVRRSRSLMDEYRAKQAACKHEKRDPRGVCYDCGHKEIK